MYSGDRNESIKEGLIILGFGKVFDILPKKPKCKNCVASYHGIEIGLTVRLGFKAI